MGQAETEQGKKRLYVSDVVDASDLKAGKLNLIVAPCGSGKTYFVEHVLKNARKDSVQDMLVLVPTIALREAFEQRGDLYEYLDGKGEPRHEWKQDGITVLTYAAFGSRVRRAREDGTYRDGHFWNEKSLICADELSQAIKQSNYPSDGRPNDTKVALKELEKRIENETNTVVTVSATPVPLINRYFYTVRGVSLKATSQLEGYKDNRVVNYYELDNLIDRLDTSQRGMIYVAHITQIEETVSLLQDRGISAVGIFSRNNAKHRMNRKQKDVVVTLVKDEMIPDDVQVLVINAAYETGLNIRPEKSRLDYIVVHDENKDTQIQVRGRYRGDIGTVYYRKEPEDGLREIPEDVIAPYLGRRLTSDDKKRLCGDLSFKDKRGRTLGWRTVKPLLEAQGYEVLEKKSGGDRYTVINIGE